MRVFVAYSQPRGKYGRYIFTVMTYFSEPKETIEIGVIRPERQTGTRTVYSCDHCGRWHTITTHYTTTTHQTLSHSEHQKDGRLELYRYDSVEPDDWIELTLRDDELLKYQWTQINITWNGVALQNYWRDPRMDKIWENFVAQQILDWNSSQNKLPAYQRKPFTADTQADRQKRFREEEKMAEEVLYEVTLLSWDEYMQSKTGDMRVEEDLIQKTMNAEEITIQELRFEPVSQLPAIQGQQQFIEGELHYLTD